MLLSLKRPSANAAVTVVHTGVADLGRATPGGPTSWWRRPACPASSARHMVRPGAAVVGAGVTLRGPQAAVRRRRGGGRGGRLDHAPRRRRRARRPWPCCSRNAVRRPAAAPRPPYPEPPMTRIADLLAAGRTFSFEFFPPKTDEAERHARAGRSPSWSRSSRRSCRSPTGPAARPASAPTTWSSGINREHADDAHGPPDLRRPHPRTSWPSILAEYREAGRREHPGPGRRPAGRRLDAGRASSPTPSSWSSWSASVGDFSVGVAAHPELHPRSPDRAIDRRHLAAKLRAGRLRHHPVLLPRRRLPHAWSTSWPPSACDKPVIPGHHAGHQAWPAIQRMAAMSGGRGPARAGRARLEAVADDPEAVRRIGVEMATELCQAPARRRRARPALLHAEPLRPGPGDLREPGLGVTAASARRASAASEPRATAAPLLMAAPSAGWCSDEHPRQPGRPARRTPRSSPAAAPTSPTCSDPLLDGAAARRPTCARPMAHATHQRRSTSTRREAAPGVRRRVHRRRRRPRAGRARRCMAPTRRWRGPCSPPTRVRFVGEPIAVVVAETAAQARRRRRAGLGRLRPAAGGRRPRGGRGTARCCCSPTPAPTSPSTSSFGRTDDLFDGCEVVVRQRIVNQRVAACPLEVRAAAAAWAPTAASTTGRSTQHAHGVRDALAGIYGLDAGQVRVVAPDVGGGFGAKIGAYPEELLLPWLARQVGRPVRWVETRTENMLAMGHGRAQVQHVEIGGTPRRHASRPTGSPSLQDAGAYPAHRRRPAVHDPHDGVRASTTSRRSSSTPGRSSPTRRRTVAYRGAGRPEATAAIERAVDLLRRRDRHGPGRGPAQEPHRRRRASRSPRPPAPSTTSATTSAALDLVLEAAGYDELRAEQAAPARGRRRPPARHRPVGLRRGHRRHRRGSEHARVEVRPDGTGDRAHRHLAARPGPRHGVVDARHRPSSASRWTRSTWCTATPTSSPTGGGTSGSRSLQLGGSAVRRPPARPRSTRAARSRRRPARGRRRTTSCSTPTAGAFHVAGAPGGDQGLGRGRRRGRRADGLVVDPRLRRRRARPSRSAPTSPSSRSTPRPARCGSSGSSRSTTPAASSTRCSSTASSTAASPRARRRRCSRRCSTTRTATRPPSTFADYAIMSAAELPTFELRRRRRRRRRSTRSAPRASASRARSARRRRCRTRWSTRSPTSASATSTCRAPPSGSGGPSAARLTAVSIQVRYRLASGRWPTRSPPTPTAPSNVSDEPIIPFIEGDGTGVDIWPAAKHVLDAAAAKHGRKVAWKEVLAGEKAFNETGDWLPAGHRRHLPGVPDRHQGPAHHADRRRVPQPQRGAAPDPRPLRVPAPGALVHGRAVAGEAPRAGRHGDLPGEHRGHLRRPRGRGRHRRGEEAARAAARRLRLEHPRGLRHRHQARVRDRLEAPDPGRRSTTPRPRAARASRSCTRATS